MKKIYLILFLIPFMGIAQAIGDYFITNAPIAITFVSNLPGANSAANATMIVPNIRYQVTNVARGIVSFQVVPLRADQPSAALLNYKIYSMPAASYALVKPANSKEVLRFGALALPIKLRSSKGEVNFQTEFNVNFALAVRLRESFINEWDLTWQIGFGLGSVGLNSSNSNVEEGKEQSVQILTGLTGLMVNYKGVQLGLYAGVDHINNQKQYDWKYNGNTFFSAGIGFNIFGGKPEEERE